MVGIFFLSQEVSLSIIPWLVKFRPCQGRSSIAIWAASLQHLAESLQKSYIVFVKLMAT